MKNKEIENILDIIEHGTEWVEDSEDSSSYKIGAYETVGFIVACLLCQRMGMKGCAASDTVDYLELHKYLPRAERKKLLIEFLKN